MVAQISPDDRHDDYIGFECQEITLAANTDTTITFAEGVRGVRVTNYSTTTPIRVKNGALSSSSDATGRTVGVAPVANVPASVWFPYRTTSIHLISSGTPLVSVEGYF